MGQSRPLAWCLADDVPVEDERRDRVGDEHVPGDDHHRQLHTVVLQKFCANGRYAALLPISQK